MRVTDVVTGLPPAAWYPDPSDPGILRWWDGESWSTHTMTNPAEPAPVVAVEPVAVEPVAVEAVAVEPAPIEPAPVEEHPSLPPVLHKVKVPEPARPLPEPMPFATGIALGSENPALRTSELPMLSPIERAARAEIYARLAGGTAEKPADERPAFDPSQAFDPVLFAAPIRPVAPPPPSAPAVGSAAMPTGTPGAWLLAFSPWISILLTVATIHALAASAAGIYVMTLVLSLGLTVLVFVAAHRDVVRLRERGYRPASIWWQLLGTLIYFIARAVELHRSGGRGLGMIFVFFGNSVASSLAFVVWFAGVGFPLLLSLRM